MAADFQASNSVRDLKVVFTDLELEPPQEAGPILNLTLMFWPRQVFDAAADSSLLLNREMIDVVQRNLNASFSLLKRLAGARSFGEVIELQAIHLSNQVAALIGQGEELATLSVKTAMEFVRGAMPGAAVVGSRGQRKNIQA
jgi:hypothetical protein